MVRIKTKKEKRFDKLSDDFIYVKCAYSDFDIFQGKIGEIVAAYQPRILSNKVNALEIGCGYGATAEVILNAREDIELFTIDNEPKMIAKAIKKLSPFRRDKRDFKVIEADALDYIGQLDDMNVDIVASVLTLHNFKKSYRNPLLKEIYRVLKDGGVFVNADKYALNGAQQNKTLYSEIEKYFDTFIPLKKYETLREWVLHHIEDQAPSRVMHEKSSIINLNKIGFKKPQIIYRNNMIAVLVAKK